MSGLRSYHSLGCGVLISCFLFRGVAFSATPFDLAAFDKLSKDDKLAVILAGMREHDSALSNIDLVVKVGYKSVVPNGTSLVEFQIEMRLLERKYRFDVERKIVRANGNNQKDIWKLAWDGNTATQWHYLEGNQYASGTINKTEPDGQTLSAVICWFLTDQLGVRRYNLTHEPVTDYLDEVTHKFATEWGIEETGSEKKYIKVWAKHTPSRQRFEWTIDPADQFVIVNYAIFRGAADGEEYKKEVEVTTKDVKEVSDVVIPWHITRSSWSEATPRTAGSAPLGKYETTAEFEIGEIKLGTVTDSDFTFSLHDKTAATRVVDQIKNTAFLLEKDGSQISKTLLNPMTGEVTGGPATAPATQPLGKD